MTAQTEMARLKEAFTKYWEEAWMVVSQLQAQAEDAKMKVVESAGEVAAAKTVALSE